MKRTISLWLVVCLGIILSAPTFSQENIFDQGNDIVMTTHSTSWTEMAEMINAKRVEHNLPKMTVSAIRAYMPYNIRNKSVIPARFTLPIAPFPGSAETFAWMFHNENRVLNTAYSEGIYTGDVFQTNQLKDVSDRLKEVMMQVLRDSIQASKKRFNLGVARQGDIYEASGYTNNQGQYIPIGRTIMLCVDRQTGHRPATLPTQEFSVCVNDGYIYTVGFVRGVADNEIIGCNNIALKKKRGSICPILGQAEVEVKLGKVETAVAPPEDMGGSFDISGVIEFLGKIGAVVLKGADYVNVGPMSTSSTYVPTGHGGESSNGYHFAFSIPISDGDLASGAQIFTRFARNENIYRMFEPITRAQEFGIGAMFTRDIIWINYLSKDNCLVKLYFGAGAAQNWRTNEFTNRHPVTTGELMIGTSLTNYACLEYQISVPIQNQLFNKTTGSVSFRVFPFKIVKAAVALF